MADRGLARPLDTRVRTQITISSVVCGPPNLPEGRNKLPAEVERTGKGERAPERDRERVRTRERSKIKIFFIDFLIKR